MRSISRLWLAVVLMFALPGAVLALPPLVITAQASPVAFLHSATNDLYVFGTVRCNRSVSVHVFVDVAQPDDQAPTAERSGSVDVSCGRIPRLWVIRLANPADDSGLYTRGPALLSSSFAAEDGVQQLIQPVFIIPF